MKKKLFNKLNFLIFGSLFVFVLIVLFLVLKNLSNKEEETKITLTKDKKSTKEASLATIERITIEDLDNFCEGYLCENFYENEEENKFIGEHIEEEERLSENIFHEEKENEVKILETHPLSGKNVDFTRISTLKNETEATLTLFVSLKNSGTENINFLATNIYFLDQLDNVLNNEFAVLINGEEMKSGEIKDIQVAIPFDFKNIKWSKIKLDPVFEK